MASPFTGEFGGEDPLSAIRHLFDVRFMTLAGFTVLVYDTFCTLDREIELIWSSRRKSFSKIVFLFYRYGAIVWTAFFLSFIIPITTYSDEWRTSQRLIKSLRCRNSGLAIIILDEVIETIGNGIVFYELIVMWGSSKYISVMMAAGFFLVHSATLAAVGLTIVQLHGPGKIGFLSLPDHDFSICVTSLNPSAFKGIYIPAVVLHVYAFTLLFFNAISRPRSSSQKLLSLLWGDGLIFFAVSLGMRLMCLVLNVAAPLSLAVLGLGLSSTIVNVAVSRLYLRLNSPMNSHNSYAHKDIDEEDDWLGGDVELQTRNNTPA